MEVIESVESYSGGVRVIFNILVLQDSNDLIWTFIGVLGPLNKPNVVFMGGVVVGILNLVT